MLDVLAVGHLKKIATRFAYADQSIVSSCAVGCIDNKRIYDRRIIANTFNKYFASIASKLNDDLKLQPLDDAKFSDFMPPRQPNSIRVLASTPRQWCEHV